MHKSRLGAIVIDCKSEDFDRDGEFWAQALGRNLRRFEAPEERHYMRLETGPDEMTILLQRVDHPSRVHIDIKTDDIDAEVRRLERLGAKPIERIKSWMVMEAPSGHRFCVVLQQPPDFGGAVNEWS